MAYICGETGCVNKVAHPGQLCVSCEADYYLDEDEYDEDWPKCGCKFCFCAAETEHGGPCGDCGAGAHQG